MSLFKQSNYPNVSISESDEAKGKVTLTYKGSLAQEGKSITAHIGYGPNDNWSSVSEIPMTWDENQKAFTCTIELKELNNLNVCFNDGTGYDKDQATGLTNNFSFEVDGLDKIQAQIAELTPLLKSIEDENANLLKELQTDSFNEDQKKSFEQFHKYTSDLVANLRANIGSPNEDLRKLDVAKILGDVASRINMLGVPLQDAATTAPTNESQSKVWQLISSITAKISSLVKPLENVANKFNTWLRDKFEDVSIWFKSFNQDKLKVEIDEKQALLKEATTKSLTTVSECLKSMTEKIKSENLLKDAEAPTKIIKALRRESRKLVDLKYAIEHSTQPTIDKMNARLKPADKTVPADAGLQPQMA